MLQGDDADAHQPLAGRVAVGDAHEDAEVSKQDDKSGKVDGALEVELNLSGGVPVDGAIDLFAVVEPLLEEVLQTHLCRDPDHRNQNEVDEDSDGALAEGGQRPAGKSVGARRAVRVKCAVALGEHEDTIAAKR